MGCSKKEEEDKSEALPNGTAECVTSEAEPKSSDGEMKWQISGDYSGDLTYTCFKIPTLTDGDAGSTTSIREDIGVVFNDNGSAGAYQDTVHISVSFFEGFYEGLMSFRFCPNQSDDTVGTAGGVVKIRTPKLADPTAVETSYDVWLQMRCDDSTEHMVTIDSHDTETKRVTGHFSNVPFRTDDSLRHVSVSAEFSFGYE